MKKSINLASEPICFEYYFLSKFSSSIINYKNVLKKHNIFLCNEKSDLRYIQITFYLLLMLIYFFIKKL